MIRARLGGTRSELSCRQVGRLLQAHLDDELDAERTRRVADHLEHCRRCGLEAATYHAVRTSIARRRPIEPDVLARLQEFGARLAAGDRTLTAHPLTIDGGEQDQGSP